MRGPGRGDGAAPPRPAGARGRRACGDGNARAAVMAAGACTPGPLAHVNGSWSVTPWRWAPGRGRKSLLRRGRYRMMRAGRRCGAADASERALGGMTAGRVAVDGGGRRPFVAAGRLRSVRRDRGGNCRWCRYRLELAHPPSGADSGARTLSRITGSALPVPQWVLACVSVSATGGRNGRNAFGSQGRARLSRS